MNKVVRHVFPAAEEGFDPQAAHDLYSGSIEQAIFETLLTYDYMARPSKLVPLTAEALPEITDDGKTYTIRLRKGIQFAADAAFKGTTARARRRGLRLLAQAAHGSQDSFALELAARRQDRRARRGRRQGQEDRQVRLRRQDRGARSRRSLHVAHPPQAARLQPVLRARARADERGGTRSRRDVRRRGWAGDGQSGRDRPLQARQMDPLVQDLSRGQPRLSRLRLGFPAGQPIPKTRASSPR